jgi:type IV pilus assembly protein PilZ
MGIRFIFENDSDRTDFESQVEALMVDSLGAHLYEKLLDKKH